MKAQFYITSDECFENDIDYRYACRLLTRVVRDIDVNAETDDAQGVIHVGGAKITVTNLDPLEDGQVTPNTRWIVL